jgi:L-alanine-DL-glutamate epimerase-like enolase superfamily enzyme
VLNALAGLALEIDEVELGRKELAVSPEFRRVTTIVHLRGGGEEGLGEDVTYLADLHDDVPVPEIAGHWTLDSFSEGLEGFRFFTDLPEDNAAQDYRRWAWESAALDLALSQAGTSLADVVGRERRPVRYVVSTRVTNVQPLLELYPDVRFKLDPGPDWSDETIDQLAKLGRVDTADFKGVYRGSFGQPPNPLLYLRIAEAFPTAWLEDPGLNEESDEVLRPYRDRITWDAPIHSVADAEALPFPPRCLNVKPSRFGTVRRLFEFYEWCEARGVAMYGGGQFELGVGRTQIQELASLFHPDMPNDVAPAEFNQPEIPRGVPRSPLPPPQAFGTKS